MAKLQINSGEIYGSLTTIKEGEKRILPSGQKARTINCLCKCGNIKDILLLHLVRGRIDSCGCKRRMKRGGLSNLKLYKIHRAINDRCSGKTNDRHRYFDRGITVCDEWKKDYKNFIDWSLQNGYKEGLQIDRIDNNSGYRPDNCRWVTSMVNGNNRENTFKVVYNNIEYPFTELVRILGREFNKDAIRTRIKRGYTCDDAFNIPITIGKYHRVNFKLL